MSSIAQVIAKMLGLDAETAEDLQRVAAIYKFDLVTGMVGEFPELQGVMGEKYALLKAKKTNNNGKPFGNTTCQIVRKVNFLKALWEQY